MDYVSHGRWSCVEIALNEHNVYEGKERPKEGIRLERERERGVELECEHAPIIKWLGHAHKSLYMKWLYQWIIRAL